MGKCYAFSDIHGNYNLFKQIKTFLKPEDICYVLGDCADRGKRGYTIIKEILSDNKFIYLKGNHEDLFATTVLTQDGSYMRCWFQNGGYTTFEEFKSDSPPIALIKEIDNLPLTATYTNQNGVKYIMSHAGFSYSAPEAIRDYLWDREHFYVDDEIPENIILVHGHTSGRHLFDCGIAGDYLKCENYNRKALYLYNNGHKLDLDCGTAASNFIALYCLDDGKVYGFYDEDKEEV